MDPDRTIPILPCRDLDAAIGFYTRLGFRLAAHFLLNGYAILETGPHELHLTQAGPFEPAGSMVAVYLRVDDADAWYARARQLGLPDQGIPRLDPIGDKPWGLREFALVDPDGTLLRIGTILPG